MRSVKHFDFHLFTHAVFFVAVGVIVFLWVSLPHTMYYTLQLAVLFLVVYFINYRFSHHIKAEVKGKHKRLLEQHYELLINASLVGGMVLLLVASTGGIMSPWFFVIYFYLFAVAMLLEREMVVVYTLVVLLFFSLLPSNASLYWYFVRLLSLLMIAPVAYYLGYKYDQVKQMRSKYSKAVKAVGKMEGDVLLWLKLEFIPVMMGVLDKLAVLMTRLSAGQKKEVGEVVYELKKLLKKADKLAESVEEKAS